MYEPQWRGEHGQGWSVWDLTPLSHLVIVTLTSNHPATGHSLWSCPWHPNAIGRGRYLQEEKPRVASGEGSLVEPWLGLLDLIIQASLGLSCMDGKFRSAVFGIVDLMTIWAAPQREMLRQGCLWKLSGTTHNPSERCHQAACIPSCMGLKALGYFWGKGNFVLLLLVLPALPLPTASGAWVATALLKLPSNRYLL